MVIAVDFDGTLAECAFPNIGSPKWDIINWVKYRQGVGDTIILWTCRENERLQEAVDACREWGLCFDYINENDPNLTEFYGNDSRKLGADIYLDDKSMHPDLILLY